VTPTATYRLQINSEFPLAAATDLVDYLAALGVSHVYSSPLLRARRGSTHGYDVVDPTALDPERGSTDDLAALVARLRAHDMGLVLDIVPNHMAASDENPFWDDVLMHGPSSPFARWFDVDWDERGVVVVPVLGDHRAAVLARGEIGVVWTGRALRIRYFEHTFPLDPKTWPTALGTSDADAVRRFAAVQGDRPADVDVPADRLAALLHAQAYRLTHWRAAAGDINYRRFFNVSDLVGIRVEDPDVFAATHALIRDWLARGWLDGLRVDHVDGLWDPRVYLERLRELAGAAPIWVEKILAADEQLRTEWPVAGTTGYEFLNQLEALFIDANGHAAIEERYRRLVHASPATGFDATARAGKRRIVDTWLAPDVRRLAGRLWELVRDDPTAADLTAGDVAITLVEFMVCFPVYRTYVDERTENVSDEDRAVLADALARTRARAGLAPAALELLADVLRLEGAARPAMRAFVQRLQQTTGPVMAKGVEDTAFYRWVPLVSRNEVGGEPGAPLDDAAAALHAANARRAARWPRTLLTTSTHDTTRSGDVRARLDVLAEMPTRWMARVARWRRLHRIHRRVVRGRLAPDPATEYLLYLSLVGIWPLDPVDTVASDDLRERLRAYMQKAVREAKVHTSWLDPDAEFEAAVDAFVQALFAPAAQPFRDDVAALVGEIARPGLWTALARTLVHLTAPGVSDVYQGDEIWNFALTDPDNRRPVDFARCRALLDTLAERRTDPDLARELVTRPEDGRVKLHVTRAALAVRRAHPALASYRPLAAHGAKARHVFGFVRHAGERTVVTIVPRLLLSLGDPPAWEDTTVKEAGLGDASFTNVLTGEAVAATRGTVRLVEALATFPVALLVERPLGGTT